MRHYVSPTCWYVYDMTKMKKMTLPALLIIWLYIKLIKWKIRKISTPLRLSCFSAPPPLLQLPSSHNHPSSLIFHPIISVLLKILFITLIKASIAATKWKKMKFGQKKEDKLVMKTEGSKTWVSILKIGEEALQLSLQIWL